MCRLHVGRTDHLPRRCRSAAATTSAAAVLGRCGTIRTKFTPSLPAALVLPNFRSSSDCGERTTRCISVLTLPAPLSGISKPSLPVATPESGRTRPWTVCVMCTVPSRDHQCRGLREITNGDGGHPAEDALTHRPTTHTDNTAASTEGQSNSRDSSTPDERLEGEME